MPTNLFNTSGYLIFCSIILWIITSVIKNWKSQKENRDRWKKPWNKKGSLGWQCKPQIPILTLWSFKKHHEVAIQQMKHELLRVRVKMGICGLHYHPNDPFLFHGFFQWSPFSFWNFQFFITLVYFLFCNPFMDYVQSRDGSDLFNC